MIDALVVGRLQAAAGTKPRIFIEYFGFGLNTGDKEHVSIAYGNELIFFMKQMDML